MLGEVAPAPVELEEPVVGNEARALWPYGSDLTTRLGEPRVLLVLLAVTGVAVVLARLLRGSLVLAALASVALWLVFAVTLLNRGGSVELGARGLLTCAVTDPRVLNAESMGNLLLFVPFGFLASASIGRPLLVFAAGLLLSVSVEVTQAMGSLGTCDSSDVVHNAGGVLLGAMLGAGLHKWVLARPPVAASAANH